MKEDQQTGIAQPFSRRSRARQTKEELYRNNIKLEILSYTSSLLLKTDKSQKVVDSICRRVMEFLHCDVFFNYLVVDNLKCLHLNAYAGIPEETAKTIKWLDYGEAVCGCAARDATRIVAENILETPDPRTDLVKSFGIQAYACHPLMAAGRAIGTLSFGTRNRPSFSEDDLQFMKTVADQLAVSMMRIKLENALEKSEEKYRKLVDSSPDAIGVYNRKGEILYANPSALKLFGAESLEQLQTKTVLEYLPPESRKIASERIARVESGQSIEFMEAEIIRLDGRVVPVESIASIIIDFERHPALLVTIRDISARKKAEKALKESEQLYRMLFERTEDAFQILDLIYDENGKLSDMVCSYANDAYEKQTGLMKSQVIGKRVKEYLPKVESHWFDAYGNVNRTGISEGYENYNQDTNRWYSVYSFKYGQDRVGVLFRDITARKNVEKQLYAEIEERKKTEENLRTAQKNLRAMALEVILTEERSRQHFATDLHDTVAQTLGAAKLRAQFIQDQIPETAKPIFTELQQMLSDSIVQARNIMAEMSPPVLNELGLLPALEWLADQVAGQYGITMKFKGGKDKAVTLPHEMEILLFQATRELLMNVVKHSHAKKASVRFFSNGQKLQIEVSDDGQGFNAIDTFQPNSKGGFGLYGIRERLRHFGGVLAIKSTPQGTTVLITAPQSIEPTADIDSLL